MEVSSGGVVIYLTDEIWGLFPCKPESADPQGGAGGGESAREGNDERGRATPTSALIGRKAAAGWKHKSGSVLMLAEVGGGGVGGCGWCCFNPPRCK